MTTSDIATPTSVDRLSALLERFRLRAQLFHHGPLCGTSQFTAEPGRAFLHVLRRGRLRVTHAASSGAPRRIDITEPTLLFYPRPLAHAFRHAADDESDFVCATLDFDGGVHHPLVRALPPLVRVPLAELAALQHTLALLFEETERVRCGQRLIADRLFEVLLLQVLRWLIDHREQSGIQTGLIAGLADPRLAKALVALHEQPGDEWTLAAMAERAGMSRSAFAAAFRSIVGQTPANYLADWRLTLAQAQLRAGRPLKAIADALGYGDASALARRFRGRYGVSPRQWLTQSAA